MHVRLCLFCAVVLLRCGVLFDVGVCGDIGNVQSSFNNCTRFQLREPTTSKQIPLPCLVYKNTVTQTRVPSKKTKTPNASLQNAINSNKFQTPKASRLSMSISVVTTTRLILRNFRLESP